MGDDCLCPRLTVVVVFSLDWKGTEEREVCVSAVMFCNFLGPSKKKQCFGNVFPLACLGSSSSAVRDSQAWRDYDDGPFADPFTCLSSSPI